MYEEKTYKIEWKSVLLKIAFALLLILIVLWLFPNNRFNDADNETNYNPVNIATNNEYNKNYIENIGNMKEAALNYYTVDRLPSNINESKSMSLQEMINNKLLISFTDANGDSCDVANSYVKVTKVSDKEYQLKVSLTCNKQDDYIKATIGCYDVCPKDDKCTYEVDELEATKIQYQLKKATNGTATTKNYYCENGYTLDGNICKKLMPATLTNATWVNGSSETYNALIEEANSTIDATATCPSGYTLNNGVCTSSSTDVIPATKTCPSGYYISGDTCIKQDTVTIQATFSCPSGYYQNGNTCTKTETTTTSPSYSCPSGYTKSGNSCYRTVQSTTNPSYSCPSGYSTSGNYCVKTVYSQAQLGGWTYSKTIKVKSPLSEYPNSYTRNVLVSKGNLEDCTGCYTYSYYYTYKVYVRSYTCSSGTLSGSNCITTSTVSKTAYCSSGYYNGSTCVTTSYEYANMTTTCPSGYVSNGSTCSRTSTVNANGNYSCPSGYNLNGTICTKQNNVTTNPNYSCPSGYNLNGTNCNKNNSITTNPNYSCPSGSTLSGNKCYTKTRTYFCLNNDTLNSNHTCTKPGGNGYYKCSTGTLRGSTCFTGAKYATVSAKYTTNIISTTGTNIQYKWSDSKDEAGWTYTGKTRIVDTEEITK